MQHFFPLWVIVLLVFAHHQGSCWLESEDAPYSAVRRLSASRRLGDFDDILGDDPGGGDSIKSKSTRPLFSWDLATVASTSPVPFDNVQSNKDTASDSADSFLEKTKHRGKKTRNKKKKKKKDMTIEDEVSFLQSTNKSSLSLGTDEKNIVSDTWMTGVRRRRKHKNKLKKERGKSKTGEDKKDDMKNPEISEKKKKGKEQKSDKSRDDKIKKEKKRKKEKKKHRQEFTRQQQENRKVGEGEQKLDIYSPDKSFSSISEKSRNRSKLKQEVNNPELLPIMPSSSEAGIYNERVHHYTLNNENSSDESLELLKNEITAGDLSSLYTPQMESMNYIMKKSRDDNELMRELSLPSMNEMIKENTKNSSTESQKDNEISLLEYDITSKTKPQAPSSERTLSNNKTVISHDQNATKSEDIITKMKNEIVLPENEIEYSTLFTFETTTETGEGGDLSCLRGTFLPAPPVNNAEIKYMRGKYLEAEYECLPNYKLEPENSPRLICNKRQWLGELPLCQPTIKINQLSNKIINDSESCKGNRGGCDQLCTLVEGKPTCSCFRGFRLDNSTCHDIDECLISNGGCEESCHNKPGSYQCGCPHGFRLAANGRTCLDINECLLRNGHGPCQDTCHNLPGSYACSCEGIEGTRLATDNHTCEDLDECARNNAGCSHTCLNTLGRAFCLCPPGFMLGIDWKTCHDIDECEDPELQEGERCAIGCINTLGSYQCVGLRDQAPDEYPTTTSTTLPPSTATEETTTTEATTLTTVIDTTLPIPTSSPTPIECLPGFERGPFGSCKDIDECDTKNGGCSHTCKNTLGSVFCLCPPGFMLANDWKTCKEMDVRTTERPKIAVICPPGHVPSLGGRCKDIDECRIQNGGCMQGCVNIKGSFRCICGRGFFLAADGKTCVEERVDIVCPPLPTPSYGYLHCTRRVFMVAPERWRARWRRRIVNHAGAVCELRCPHGYKVHGEYRKVCESDGKWAGPEDGFCMPLKAHHVASNEIPQVGSAHILRGWRSWYGIPSHNSRNYIHVTYAFPKPKIECPHNISMEIEPGQATAFVAFPQPITDVDWFRNVVAKPSWGKLLEADLPVGHWTITYTARHPISRHTSSCTLGITISSSGLTTEKPKGLV